MCSSWKKAADYNIAFYCVMFGGFQYYQSQQLLSEVRRTEVIRYILSSDPTNKAMIEKSTPSSEKKVSMPYIIKLNSYTDANKLTISFVQPVCLHIIRICSDSRIQIKGVTLCRTFSLLQHIISLRQLIWVYFR